MSKTRTLEFNVSQRLRCVVQEQYISQHREAFKGTELERLSTDHPDDEEFLEIILRRAVREFLQDCLREGLSDTPGLRGRHSPPRVERIDGFKKRREAPAGAIAVLASEVTDAIPS